MIDLLIKNGLIVDGTGSPGFYGAAAITGDTVHILRGDVSGLESARTIDATGKVVSPGFIDFHAHSALMPLWEPRHEPKVRQGITTELIGVDGNSYAPFSSEEDLIQFADLNSGLEGSLPLPGRWSSVAEYLDLFDGKVAVNIAYIIGNSAIRIGAMGWKDRPASPADIRSMRAILREGMEDGAFGISTGLDYPPGCYADTDELVQLSEEAARLGGIYHTHLRNTLGDRFLDPMREAIEIGRRSGIPSHLTHLYQRITHPGGARRMLQVVEDAYDEGLDVTFDTYPYLLSSTRALIVLPLWCQEGGPKRVREVLGSAEGRERLRAEMRPRGTSWHDMWLTYFKQPANHRYEGLSLGEIAEAAGQHPVDVLCDFLLEDGLQVSYVTPGANGPTLPEFVTHPLSMVGTDGVLVGDYPSPRTYGTFPAILSEYVREERLMSLPFAIRKMTSFPAQRLGLSGRGILRDGFKADLVVFDLDTVRSPATRRDPKQFPVGIDHVIINGALVIDAGSHTGATPGRALRRGRPGG
ncbi:MAG: D-aminoacylase [Dehalococcoidia bacterium]|jgi:N-acyl-D-amino-acid deacylase|nr:D-aminoacylase [Dehalococcoidia bacterium]MDP6227707.1 D-aminoacylase [Dehalococcoidia bacterium]MDP7085376.1 D-aminoacylase [Dehalococcoidia bacterium]MDP7200972.1 D-aminoacylase [Dehalococcoidia bacterium]HJN87731.1 D-aminoacylase [Dehalococcoidia bacterium]